nr:ras association domain-containing protein 1 homolog isoform X1 [Cherax quadricarinatus]
MKDCQEEQEEKHEEEAQEKEMKEEIFKKCEEVSTLRKTVNRLQSHLVDNETLEAWVERYNATAQGLQISKEDDGSFRGCVRVHLNLSRPINIVAGTRPPSIYDILQEDRTMEKTLTSFYMPRDAVKAIHITSNTTTREVIIALLRKFKVVDNPQKFALYERTYDTAQSVKAKLRRLGDNECPLVLALNWSAGGLTNKRLVLQENDTADIQWEAFSLPELSNFLRILDREEEEYRCQIQDKYALLRRRIGNILFQSQQKTKE